MTGFVPFLLFNAEGTLSVKAQNSLQSCINYPYDLGVNFKYRRSGSFQLLSTSTANIRSNKTQSLSSALKEAGLRAKLNISSFIKITNSPKEEIVRNTSIPI